MNTQAIPVENSDKLVWIKYSNGNNIIFKAQYVQESKPKSNK